MIDTKRARELAGLSPVLSEKKLSEVDAKNHPPEGLFANGSSESIIKWLKGSHRDLRSAMSALTFFINRAGKNLIASRKAELEQVKVDLRKAYGLKEEQFSTLRKWAGLNALPIVEMDDAEESAEDSAEEPKDAEEAEEIPSIVSKIATKAEGMKGDELVALIGQVYDAGFKDGQSTIEEPKEVTESTNIMPSLPVTGEASVSRSAIALAKAGIEAFLTMGVGGDDTYFFNFKNEADMKKAEGIIATFKSASTGFAPQ